MNATSYGPYPPEGAPQSAWDAWDNAREAEQAAIHARVRARLQGIVGTRALEQYIALLADRIIARSART